MCPGERRRVVGIMCEDENLTRYLLNSFDDLELLDLAARSDVELGQVCDCEDCRPELYRRDGGA